MCIGKLLLMHEGCKKKCFLGEFINFDVDLLRQAAIIPLLVFILMEGYPFTVYRHTQTDCMPQNSSSNEVYTSVRA